MPDTPASSQSSKAFFTQKVAGVPLVAWVAVVAVGVGGFLWWHNRQTAAAAAAAAQNAQGTNGSGVPIAGTSEELQAAGLYQPPSITYNLGNPPTETPPTQASLPPGKFLGSDGVLYDASAFWWVGGLPYPKWQFATAPSPGSPGAVGFLIPPQGWPFTTIPAVPPAPTSSPPSTPPSQTSTPAPQQTPTSLGFPGVPSLYR